MSEEKLLQEIGELFGRFRVDPGDNSPGSSRTGQVISFTDRIKDLTGKNYDQQTGPFSSFNPRNYPFFSGPLVTEFNSGRFYNWQKKVISALSDKKDVYVVAPPGGGKTTPLMAHWMVNMFLRGKNGCVRTSVPLDEVFSNGSPAKNEVVSRWSDIFSALFTGKYLNGQDAPRVLFITPIRVLSFEQAEKFQEYLLDLLLFFVTICMKHADVLSDENKSLETKIQFLRNEDITTAKIVANVLGKVSPDVAKHFFPKKDGEINIDRWALEFTQKLITVKTGGGSGDFNSRPEESIVTIATYGAAKNFIGKIMNTVKFIVYDEAHLYMPSDFSETDNQVSQSQEITAASDAYKIIKTIISKSDVQLAFLSGTINPVSAENFSDYLNGRYSRRMVVCKTEKGDPQAVNKTQLRVIPDDSLRNDDNIINNVVRWVNREEKGNAVIFFSKARIEKIVSGAKKKLSQSNLNDISNRSNSVDRVKEEQIKRYRRSLAYTNMDSSEIEKKVQEFIKREYPTTQQQHIGRIMSKPGANQIENKDLRDAVAYGIGYIYTQDDEAVSPEDRRMGKSGISEKDKRIVADLFSNGKIYALLATPSIGIGVNVSIRNMYIPTLNKFTGSGKDFSGSIQLNNRREMSQLINRAGRGKVNISGLYTPQEFVPYLRDITLMTNDDFPLVPAIDIRKSDDLQDVIMRLRWAATSSNGSMSKLRRAYGMAKSAAVKTGTILSRFASFLTAHKLPKTPGAQSASIQSSDRNLDELMKRISAEVDNVNYYNSNILKANLDSVEQQLDRRVGHVYKFEEILKQRREIYDRSVSNLTSEEKQKMLKKMATTEANIDKAKRNLFKEYHEIKKKINESISGLEKNLESTPENSQRILELNKIKKKIEERHSKLERIPDLMDEIRNKQEQIRTIDNEISNLRNNQQLDPNLNRDFIRELEISKLEKQRLINELNSQIQKLRNP